MCPFRESTVLGYLSGSLMKSAIMSNIYWIKSASKNEQLVPCSQEFLLTHDILHDSNLYEKQEKDRIANKDTKQILEFKNSVTRRILKCFIIRSE
jgi:hypothetical protein